MAKNRIVVALTVSSATNEWEFAEKALRRHVRSAWLWVLQYQPISEDHREDLRKRLLARMEQGFQKFSPLMLPLAINALCALEALPSANIAISTISGPSHPELTGGIQSHYQARSVLIEPIRGDHPDIFYARELRSFNSLMLMPYEGKTGSTAEQDDRGRSSAIRGVIDGWAAQSERYHGILQRLGQLR